MNDYKQANFKDWVPLFLVDLDFRGHRFLDVGASGGEWCEDFHGLANGDCLITAVEPNPKNCEMIRNRMSRLKCDWTILEGVVVPENSKGSIYFMAEDQMYDWGSNGFIIEDENFEKEGFSRISVERFSLADLCQDASVVKIDIEGMEYLVLPEVLQKVQPVEHWFVEMHEDPKYSIDELVNEFTRHGYAFDIIPVANGQLQYHFHSA